VRHGLRGFLATVDAPGIQAPLTTALTALAFVVTGPNLLVGFALPVLAGAITIAATYGLGAASGTRREGLFAAALVASCPLMIMYARSYQFALPAACMATLALLALLRSRRFAHAGWAVAFGVFCGLMLLARTMTVAFVPGLLLAAVLWLLGERRGLARRGLILAGALLVGAAVAAMWYWPNGHLVFGYLRSFGYGRQAADYGTSAPLFSGQAWLNSAHYVAMWLYLPQFLVLLAGAAAWLLLAGRSLVLTRLAGLRGWALSPLAPLAIFVAEATLALTSSQNKGTGFFVPILPAAMVLAVWGVSSLVAHLPWPRVSGAAAAGIGIAVAALGAVPALDLDWTAARPWSVDVPPLGRTMVTDGRGYIQIYEGYGDFPGGDAMRPISTADGAAWVALSARLSSELLRLGAARSTVAFGYIHLLANHNTVRLATLMAGEPAFEHTVFDPLVTGDTEAGDVAWLTTGAAKDSCLLATLEGKVGLVFPSSDPQRMTRAARSAGFAPDSELPTPDGQSLTIWTRSGAATRCQPQ